jgi:hypothetical protein
MSPSRFRRAAATLFVLALCAACASPPAREDLARSWATLVRVDDLPAWSMAFDAAYSLDALLEDGAATEGALLRFALGQLGLAAAPDDGVREVAVLPRGKACTGFSAGLDAGGRVVGHNEDWESGSYLVVVARPVEGYGSIGLVDVDYADAFRHGRRAAFLVAPFFPLAGMNERGLAVSTYSVPTCEPPARDDAPDVLWPAAIRILLDRAATVDEALALLDAIDPAFSDGNKLQFLIADAAGGSAVVAWLGGRAVVTRPSSPWQVVANFILHGAAEGDFAACERWTGAESMLAARSGTIDRAYAMRVLESASRRGWTRFSAVFDLGALEADLVFGRKYGLVRRFSLRD